MAARNRPRAVAKDDADAHEERDLWSRIVTDLKELTRQSKRIKEVTDEIASVEAKVETDGGELHPCPKPQPCEC